MRLRRFNILETVIKKLSDRKYIFILGENNFWLLHQYLLRLWLFHVFPISNVPRGKLSDRVCPEPSNDPCACVPFYILFICVCAFSMGTYCVTCVCIFCCVIIIHKNVNCSRCRYFLNKLIIFMVFHFVIFHLILFLNLKFRFP